MSLSDNALVTLVQAKNFLRKDAASSLHIDAEYVGVGDGAETEFELDHAPIEGSLKLYLNNTLLTEATHYSIDGADITFIVYPPAGHPITASYDYAASSDTFESYDDDLLERLIEAATKKCEDHAGVVFIQRSIAETHIGDGSAMLRLYKYPVVSTTSVKLGSVALSEWVERLAIGRIYYNLGFTEDYEVVVVYTAGHGATRDLAQATIPDAVLAVLSAIAVWYENRLGLRSQSIAGIGSADYGDPGDLPEVSKGYLSSLMRSII